MPMPATRFSGAFIALLAFASMSTGAAIAESQYLVVAADPPSDAVEIGKLLVVGDTINVPAGVVVTLMGEKGSVNKLTGPTAVVVTEDSGSAVASEDDRSTLSKLGELLKSDKNTADRLGASRSSRAATAPDPWAVPLDAKTVCVRDGLLKLKRAKDAGPHTTVAVEVDGTPSPGRLSWAAGKEVFEFPQKLAPDAKIVRVQLGDSLSELVVVHVPATVDPGPAIETLSVLNQGGCTEQMLALARSIAG